MARLRVRLELNRRSAGVPLDKLASVVEETRRFFHLLAEDVHIDSGHAEWVASDFDPESLNFTAEYSGHVTADQVRAFGAAFAGATSLRRATIAQFTRIADFLGEDELVGFGLFQADQETEPSEWRCLSKRDAQRFGQEIRLLAEAAGESQTETSLPAVMNGSVAGRRLFKDRREREALAANPAKLIREVEANLSRRIDLIEGQVESQARKMNETRQIAAASDDADERFQRLLVAMEKFWTQAPRQTALLAAPAPAPTAVEPAPFAPQPVVVAPEPLLMESGPAAPVPVPAPEASAASLEAPAANLETPAANLETPAAKPESVSVPEEIAEAPAPPDKTAPKVEELPLTVPAAKKHGRWWVLGGMAAAAVALSFTIPEMQRQWLRYTSVETMPITHPKPPAAPQLPAAAAPTVPLGKVSDAKPEQPVPAKPSEPKPKVADHKISRHTVPFQGPQIALEIPASVRGKVQSEARVQVIVAIDDQGNVIKAEVASTKGKGARLLAKEALAAARRARFRPAREGEKAVESQMVLTYSFKPDSPEF